MDFACNATTVIAAAPALVFELITDIDRLPEWNAEVVKVVERSGTDVGAEWVVGMHALHTRWNSRSRVVAIDAERGRFAYRSQSDDGNPSYADWRWEVVPHTTGARVAVAVEAHPRTFWRRVLLSRIRPSGLQKAMDESLRALGSLLAAQPTAKATNDNES